MTSNRLSHRGDTREGTFGRRAQERMLRRHGRRKRVGWILIVVGAIAFLGGNIGARTGLTFLPFDPHHVYAQLGGAVAVVSGLIVMTSDPNRRR